MQLPDSDADADGEGDTEGAGVGSGDVDGAGWKELGDGVGAGSIPPGAAVADPGDRVPC